MRQIYALVATFICCSMGLLAQNSPYVSRVLEYKPAPGQFINTLAWGSPSAARSVIGGINGHVSLGAYGGYIVVGFDHSIMNDPNNPYGVDFTVFGNAFTGWAEPGIVMVMKDVNGNGLPDDTWYELKGSDYDLTTTLKNYGITYSNPGGYANVPWIDSRNIRGTVAINTYHTQPYYPSADSFPNINQTQYSLFGTLIVGNIDASIPTYIRSYALAYGYADNYPKQSGDPVTQPDNPATTTVIEGAGGDAMKIEWAIDAQGNSVTLDRIDFVKIYTGLNRMCGWLGEVSTEVCGVVDVAPSTTAQTAITTKLLSAKKVETHLISIYPAATNTKNSIISGFDVFNINGESVLKSDVSDINKVEFSGLVTGIYQAKAKTATGSTLYQIIIE